jgi:hypothetical protein
MRSMDHPQLSAEESAAKLKADLIALLQTDPEVAGALDVWFRSAITRGRLAEALARGMRGSAAPAGMLPVRCRPDSGVSQEPPP